MKDEWRFIKNNGHLVELLKTSSVDAVDSLARSIKKDHWNFLPGGGKYKAEYFAVIRSLKNPKTGECWFWDAYLASHWDVILALGAEEWEHAFGSEFLYRPGGPNDDFEKRVENWMKLDNPSGDNMTDLPIGPKEMEVMKKWFAARTDEQLAEIASNWGVLSIHRSPKYVEGLRRILLAEATRRGLVVKTGKAPKKEVGNKEWYEGGRGAKAYRDYMYYLKHTIIPDTLAAGAKQMAADLSKMMGLIETRTYDVPFVKYITETLLPSIARTNAESGYIKDFEVGMCFLQRRATYQNPPRGEFRYDLPARGYGAMVNAPKMRKVHRPKGFVYNPITGNTRKKLVKMALEHERDAREHKSDRLKSFDAGTAAGIREALANPRAPIRDLFGRVAWISADKNAVVKKQKYDVGIRYDLWLRGVDKNWHLANQKGAFETLEEAKTYVPFAKRELLGNPCGTRRNPEMSRRSNVALWKKVYDLLARRASFSYVGSDYQLGLVKAIDPKRMSQSDEDTLRDLWEEHTRRNPIVWKPKKADIEKARAFWIKVAKENGWYEKQIESNSKRGFFLYIWHTPDGRMLDTVYAPKGNDRDMFEVGRGRIGNPLTRKEAANLLRMGKHFYNRARETSYPEQRNYFAGLAEGYTGSVRLTKAPKKAHRIADLMSAKLSHRNPPEQSIPRQLFNKFLTEIWIGTVKKPLGGLPEGHFYATHMGEISLDQFHLMRDIAVRNGLITVSGHLMKATKKLIDIVGNIDE